MEKYFNINYEFDHARVQKLIDEKLAENGHGYIAVADLVVVNLAQRNKQYRKVLDGTLFAISDSSWGPVFLRWLYGHHFDNYTGAQIFEDLVGARVPVISDERLMMSDEDGTVEDKGCAVKDPFSAEPQQDKQSTTLRMTETWRGTKSKYRMAFIGTNTETLEALRANVAKTMNPDVVDMLFYELPFCKVDEFDYPAIAKMLEEDGADIIWVALGAPKQERFMAKLDEHLKRGVQIAVGAVFKFYSGKCEKRAPEWIREHRLEFLYRIYQDPKKQLRRCFGIVRMLPQMLVSEWWRMHKRG